MASCLLHDSFQLVRGPSLDQQVRRPADPERGQRRERRVRADALVAQERPQRGGQRREVQLASDVGAAFDSGSVGVGWLQQYGSPTIS